MLSGEMTGSEWQRHGECRAAAFFAAHRDRATMQFHELVHERKTDTGAFVRTSFRIGHAIESFEQARDLRCWNPHAGISNLETDAVARLTQSDFDAAL